MPTDKVPGPRRRWLLKTGLLLLALTTTLAIGQDLVLNPAEITGRVRVGNEILDQVDMIARNLTLGASRSFTPETADPTIVDYQLTVDVPIGGERDYRVLPAAIHMDGMHDKLVLFGELAKAVEGSPVTADFIIEPGYLEGTFITAGSEAMTRAVLTGIYQGSFAVIDCLDGISGPCFSTSTDSGRGFAYRIAVLPGTNIRLQPQVTLADGKKLILDSIQIDIASGETLTQDIVVPSPDGSISGMIEMPGAETVHHHEIVVWGPAQTEEEVGEDGPFAINGLPAGGYGLNAFSYFGEDSPRNLFRHPGSNETPDRGLMVIAGESTSVAVSSEQTYIQGEITISGSAGADDITEAIVTFRDPFGGGVTTGPVNLDQGGAYRLVATEEDWKASRLKVKIQRYGNEREVPFTESLGIVYSQPPVPGVVLSAGDTATADFDVPMGMVTAWFSVRGGRPLSAPQLAFQCARRDASDGLEVTASGESLAHDQDHVTLGVTSFLAPAGLCQVTPRAVVNGSLTGFGTFEVEVEAGLSKEICLTRVAGFLPPLSRLVPASMVPPLPRHRFNPPRTLPLRFGICGEDELPGHDQPAPEIVALLDERRGPVDLSQIDLDTGASNGNTLFFRPDDGLWRYNLNTRALATGTVYTITIRMPDGEDYKARFALRDGKKSRQRRRGR